MLMGPDVSKFQGNIDFTKLRADFIIIATTDGLTSYNDKYYATLANARKVGMPVGRYHFAQSNNAVDEAYNFLNKISTDLITGDLLFLDYELPLPASDVDKARMVTWCKAWLDKVYAHTNCRPLIYLNQNQMNNANWKPVIDGGYGLWLAKYDYNPNAPTPTTPWSVLAFRQYSNKATYVGIPAPTDDNVFYGDITALKAYGYHGGVAPTPVDYKALYDAEVIKYNALKVKYDADEAKLTKIKTIVN